MNVSGIFLPKSLVETPGRVAYSSWPEKDPIPFICKGGDPNWHVFEFPVEKEMILKEKNISLLDMYPTDSQQVNLLMRAADLVRERGQVRPLSDVPVIEEAVGIFYNQVRRRRKISLERLARDTGFAIEEIIAFETGLLPRLRMCEMLPNLAREVGVDFARLFPKFRLHQK
jgi:hypothetical protein